MTCDDNDKRLLINGKCTCIAGYVDDGTNSLCKACGVITLVSGKYQMSNGTTFKTCEEYKEVLGGNAVDGFYH